ncbi:STK36 kinase, partial [Amia calva]|nr:STK36 kinase [Amia calva]
MEKYHVLEMIGEGSFGRVYKGRKKYSGEVVALKFIPKVGRSEKELCSLKKEIEIMRGLRHPNVVLLLDSFETNREVVVVMEYAEGELFQILEDDGSLPESQVREIACQLVSALYYLHSNRILHRDMKPQNILLGKGGVVKLCDFGFARAMSVSTLVLTSIKGTPLYMSPELVEEKPYDHTADLWSLGCILYELHTGAPPFYTNSIFHLVQLIVRDPVKWPESMSPECTSFLKGLLTKDPQKRLSWPFLLKHPFVTEGVLVLSDSGSDNPLTEPPSPDVKALKLQQMKEKAAPRSGEGRLLRKAREQQDRGKQNKLGLSASAQMRNIKEADSETARMQAAPDPGTPSNNNPDWTVDQTAVHPAVEGEGQISRDYAREFPSVEVGPRQVTRRERVFRDSLGSVRLDTEEVDSDEEWQRLVDTTEPGNQLDLVSYPALMPRLKERLLGSRAQLLAGMLEGACRIRPPLRVLGNLLLVNSDPALLSHMVKEIDLPHFLLDLIMEILKNPAVKQQPWCVTVVGDLMATLGVYWDRHFNLETAGQRLGDGAQLLSAVLLHPDLAPLMPLAASLLALLSHHGVPLELNSDQFVTAMEKALSSPVELRVPLPRGWGLYDGLVTLLYQAICEGDIYPVPQFLDSALWRLLWLRVGAAMEETASQWDSFSLTGLQVFLSLTLFVFTREPYRCVPLLANSNTDCVLTLAQLLTVDGALLEDGSSAQTDTHSRGQSASSANSVSVMTCHLLCFPFALDIPGETVEDLLLSYRRCNVVPHLLQLSLSLPLSLLEVPLSLLCRLLLSDPQHCIPQFIAAAEAWDFFNPSAKAEQCGANGLGGKAADGKESGAKDSPDQSEARTASSLLASFLQSEALSGSAVELLSLVGQAARCSLCPELPQLYINPSLLRMAFRHPDNRVRAATCSLLGNISPLAAHTPAGQPFLMLFQDLIGQLQDQSLQVRRAACRAVGNWLGFIGQAGEQAKALIVSEAQKENGQSGMKAYRVTGATKGRAKGNGSKDPADAKPGKALPFREGADPEMERWAELSRGAAMVLLPLLSEADPVIRRHCCAALGNLAGTGGGGALLLQFNGPRLLLQTACTDSHHAVQQAAITALRFFSQHDALRQALVSLDASEKLRHLSQHASHQRHCHWLINKLQPPVSA